MNNYPEFLQVCKLLSITWFFCIESYISALLPLNVFYAENPFCIGYGYYIITFV